MHAVAMRQKVAPAQRDLAWIAELELGGKSEGLSESPWRESGQALDAAA